MAVSSLALHSLLGPQSREDHTHPHQMSDSMKSLEIFVRGRKVLNSVSLNHSRFSVLPNEVRRTDKEH